MLKNIENGEEIEPPGLKSALLQGEDTSHALIASKPGNSQARRSTLTLVGGRLAKTVQTTERTLAFRKRFYPDVSCAEWEDWRWQLRNRITAYELEQILRLSEDERIATNRRQKQIPVAITPYYASFLDEKDPEKNGVE